MAEDIGDTYINPTYGFLRFRVLLTQKRRLLSPDVLVMQVQESLCARLGCLPRLFS